MTTKDVTLYDSAAQQLLCRGDWDIANLPQLKTLLEKTSWPKTGDVTVDGAQINKMDSAGAWLLSLWQNKLKQQGVTLQLEKFNKEHQSLLTIVKKEIDAEKPLPEPKSINRLAKIGMVTCKQFSELTDYLAFIGQLATESMRIIQSPKHIRWGSHC